MDDRSRVQPEKGQKGESETDSIGLHFDNVVSRSNPIRATKGYPERTERKQSQGNPESPRCVGLGSPSLAPVLSAPRLVPARPSSFADALFVWTVYGVLRGRAPFDGSAQPPFCQARSRVTIQPLNAVCRVAFSLTHRTLVDLLGSR